jgi:hypothetical protein
MILTYVDDILCISKQTAPIMKHIASIYRLKDDSIGEPKRYLGANIGTWVLGDGRQEWSMSAASYIKSAVENIEFELAHGPHKCRSYFKTKNFFFNLNLLQDQKSDRD